MYLCAQRVQSPAGEKGINAFHYAHGAGVEPALPLREGKESCGTLLVHNITVEPPGNRIRSYLDIVTLDGTPEREIRNAIITVLAPLTKFPLEGKRGNVFVKVGMDQETAGNDGQTWTKEVGELIRAIVKVRLSDAEVVEQLREADAEWAAKDAAYATGEPK